jgi:hypothetical protein
MYLNACIFFGYNMLLPQPTKGCNDAGTMKNLVWHQIKATTPTYFVALGCCNETLYIVAITYQERMVCPLR